MRNTSVRGAVMTGTVYGCEAFERDYSKFSPTLQQLTEGAVKDLISRIRSLPAQWRREYQRVKGLDRKVLEIDVSGGYRLLAVDHGDITLWRVGDHDLIKKVVADRPPYPSDNCPLPPAFDPAYRSTLFPPGAPVASSLEQLANFVNENSGEWIYELASEQTRVGDEIVDSVESAVLEGRRRVFAVLGGPGTGKTAILVWLLKQFADVEPGGRRLAVRLVMPHQVIRQLERCTGWDLTPFLYEKQPDVVLIDDPKSLSDIDHGLIVYPSASVIAGFDPLQMGTAPTDRELEQWSVRNAVNFYWLRECYRQKAAVGEAARHVCDVIAESSPFLDVDKKSVFKDERATSTGLANAIDFVNPGGSYRVAEASPDQALITWAMEIGQLRSAGGLWTHIEPILVVVDSALSASSVIRDQLAPLQDAGLVDVVSFEESESRKGVDYQHALFVISRMLHGELTSGFEGKGRKNYEKIRLFRIPFTRPKDSMTVIVWD